MTNSKILTRWEEIENQILAPEAAHSNQSVGRKIPESPCPIRTCYQRDKDRIIHSKAFRRLKTKTQVFIATYGDHYRTRLTHTLEVMQISRTIARALRLNEDLTEAIALGHDLGHTPFGHAGERSLAEITGHFRHNEQSLRVVDILEKNGAGLNLTMEVRDGILSHSGNLACSTLEAAIVQTADRIAYVNHDIDDAIRAGLLAETELPQGAIKVLGSNSSNRINSLVISMIENSLDLTRIRLGEAEAGALNELRDFLFKNIYRSPKAIAEEEKLKSRITKLYCYYQQNPNLVPENYLKNADLNQSICDYIAGMSDSYAFAMFREFNI